MTKCYINAWMYLRLVVHNNRALLEDITNTVI